MTNPPKGYSVSKTDGQRGWHWTCPKGFNHYNFVSEEAAIEDANSYAKIKEANHE